MWFLAVDGIYQKEIKKVLLKNVHRFYTQQTKKIVETKTHIPITFKIKSAIINT